MVPATTSLIGFSGEIKWPLGQITLLVKIRDDEHSTSAWMDFMVVRSTSPHNGIIGRPGLRKIQAVPSTTHGMIKFPVTGGILTLKSSKIIPVECAMVSGPEEQPISVNKVREERVKVAINPEHPEQTVMIGSNLTEKTRGKLCNLLQRSLDIFAWTPTDMTGVPRHIAEHRLNVRKVHYHDWLSNPVMVKKSDNSWRMCVDFKDLNKACPKDGYPLPEIDWKVESLCGFPFKCFLDAYKGYHQIQMAEEDEIVRDIEETFKTLRKNNMKLNPKKCTFGVKEGMFLGYQVNTKGIKICRDKEELIIYLAASKEAVSVVLMTKREARLMPIYFVSRALRGPEVNYTPMEKVVLALVHASKRLRRYFQAHPIIVITDQPIKNILSNPEVAGRMQKWSIQLGEFGIQYRPRVSVKGQVLADFIIERPEEEGQDDSAKEEEPLPAQWTLFTDGSSCVDGCGAGVILTDPEGVEFTYALRFQFEATNNEAEYEALIARLRIAERIGVQNLQVNVDSKLVANQVNGTYIAKETDMIKYLEKVKALAKDLKENLVNESEVLAVVEKEGESWMTPIHEYLTDETLPAERKKARKIKRFTLPKEINKEAKPVATITGNQVKKFVWENIVCRFGLPGEIISDNGKQFRDNPFKDWCEKLCIQQHFASVKHPQTNGLVERANRSLGEGIKARLGKDNKNWMEEISHVLWAHRTMVKSSNGDTPFSLTYGTEAVIPAEIGMPTFRTAELDMAKNDEALQINLELLEEKREQAAITEAKSKRQMEKYYNAKVQNTSFKPGDLVYRNNEASRAEDTGKLGPKWEGPYEVTEALGKGSYRLKDRNGKELPRTWNVSNLKKCYVHKM
ncbi:reverse transcriptase domain-containing protein [Tanacetum coccineum]